MKLKTGIKSILPISLLALVYSCNSSQQKTADKKQPTSSKPDSTGVSNTSTEGKQKMPMRVFWGVAHVHTGYSFDARECLG